MKALITQAQLKKMRRNGQDSARNPEIGFGHAPVVKLFTPDGQATWLLTEIDPADEDRAFGLCDLGLGEPGVGYVSLHELSSVRGHLGLRVERDLYFTADKPLRAYLAQAKADGRIDA